MRFHVSTSSNPPMARNRPAAVLTPDNWDDWGQYQTTYDLWIHDGGEVHQVGKVKIGQFAMGPGHRRGDLSTDSRRSPDLPSSFESLDTRFFSLGQDLTYYTTLRDAPWGRETMIALRDIAFDLTLFESARTEEVITTSLLRSVAEGTVLGQFHRVARGGREVTTYSLRHDLPAHAPGSDPAINFTADPESVLPTNLHALIGRNGTGKTTILNSIASRVADTLPGADDFVSVVQVSFSSFDIVPPPGRHTPTPLVIVGADDHDGQVQKLQEALAICLKGTRIARLSSFLRMLDSDPILDAEDFPTIVESASRIADIDPIVLRFTSDYRRMSAGHKVLLLAAIQLVRHVEERTLVLVDEPESHLHPPLLSAFVRALSDLMADRNGMAIISTHSPVVLQELPRACVWRLSRSGDLQKAERPTVETFGESLSVLTSDAFGLELRQAGFHRFLKGRVEDAPSLGAEEVIAGLDGQVGSEGRALIYALVANRREWGA